MALLKDTKLALLKDTKLALLKDTKLALLKDTKLCCSIRCLIMANNIWAGRTETFLSTKRYLTIAHKYYLTLNNKVTGWFS